MLEFYNQYGTTSGHRGFKADDADLIQMWDNYYGESIAIGQAVNDLHANVNDTCFGEIYHTLNVWLWSLISAKLPKTNTATNNTHKLWLTGSARTMSNADAASVAYMTRHDHVNSQTNFGAPVQSIHEIEVLYIKKGNDAFSYFTERYKDYEIPSISTLLTIDRYHKINVYKGERDRIFIITNRWESKDWFKILGLLPVFFPDIKKVVDGDTTLYTILKSFFDNSPDLILPILSQIVEEYKATAAQRNIAKLFAAISTQKNKGVQNTQNNIDTLLRTITEREKELAAKYLALENEQRTLTGLLTTPFVIDENLKGFLENNKAIKIININNNDRNMRVQFTTPVMNWNVKDIEMYYKHPEIETYLNTPAWFGDIIKKIFIEEKYRLICTTVVNMPIYNRGDANEWSTDSSPSGTYGNTHFTQYNCYSSSKEAYIKAINKNDYVSAFSIILAATATYVFTDSNVIRHFSAHFKEGGSAYTRKVFQDVETGAMYSMAELREINAEKPPAEKTKRKSTKTTTPATTGDIPTPTLNEIDPIF